MKTYCSIRCAARALVLGLLVMLQTAACLPLCAAAPNPVGWWKFDEGTGTSAADSAGGNTGTLQSGAVWATGQIGPFAVSLPGNSTGYVDVPAAVIDTTQSYTAMAWVKLSSVSGYQTILSIDGTQVSGFFLQKRTDTGGFALTALSSDSTGGTTSHAAGGSVSAGQWYHVAGVYDATAHTLSLYVNARAAADGAFTAAWKATGHTEIGRGLYGGSKTDFVNGQIDDARLYNAAPVGRQISAPSQESPRRLHPARRC